jgi:hypothetical protein
MKLRFDSQDKKLILNQQESFRTDSGWDESIQSYEDELLRSIINPIENYETNRYIHKPYISSAASTPSESAAEEEGTVTTNTQINTIEQTDIWFYFYFVKNGSYTNGLDYKSVGISQTDKLLSDLRNSFFRLEFYKTPDGEQPNRTNRRLVFAKNLSPAVGERVSVTGKTEKYYVPVFMGSSMRNKENMYLFWFHDDTVLEETTLTGGTFFMSAKFYNAVDGSKILFGNKPIADSSTVTQEDDLYYRVEMSRNDAGEPTYHYVVTEENGTYPYLGTRKGTADNPILFYQMEGTTAAPTPTATPISNATPTPSATSNTPTPTPSSTSSSPTITWSAGTFVSVSAEAPQQMNLNDISGTVTVTNGSVNVYIQSSKATNFSNVSSATLNVTSVGSLSVTCASGDTTENSLPSVLTIPPGTYNYTLGAEITLDSSFYIGVAQSHIYTQ